MANKYNVNTKIFDEITPESSWLLGWLLSDGNLYNDRVKIMLLDKDIDAIHKMIKILEFNGPINKRVVTNSNWAHVHYGFSFYRKNISEILKKYSLIPKKSLILKYPATIDWINMRHFVRGYFEGDGHMGYNKNRNCLVVEIKGSYDFLKRLKFNMKNCLGIGGGIYKSKNAEFTYDYKICGNNAAVMFLNWIYGSVTENIRLDRKYNQSILLYNTMLSKRKTEQKTKLIYG